MQSKGLALLGLMVAGNCAQAAGFALYEHSASALGTAFTGQAVMAQDASTMFGNPAGLTEVQGSQFVVGGTVIQSSVRYSDGTGGDGGNTSLVPSMYYAMDLRPDLKLGLGVYAPFGLRTEYDTVWSGNGQGILSDMKTLDINPTLAWRAGDRLSLGLGVDYQSIKATLTNNVSGVPAVPVVATMSGDDTGWGYNLGLTYQLDDATRVGLSYRSRIKYHLTGTLNATVPALPLPGLTLLPQPIYADITLPDMASLAVQHKLDDRWTILADATWTGWSVFKNLTANLSSTGFAVSSTPEDWRNAWRFGLGATYRRNDNLTWRFGVAYDQTPIPDASHRYARIPDTDRTTAAAGFRYAMSRQNLIDVGYDHIFFKSAPTDNLTPGGGYHGHADILGMQLTHNF